MGLEEVWGGRFGGVPQPILASKGYWLYLVARGPVRVPQPMLASKGYWLYLVVRILPWGSLGDLGGRKWSNADTNITVTRHHHVIDRSRSIGEGPETDTGQ